MSKATIVAPPAGPAAPKARNHTADALRGLAALAVCWYHFTHGNPTFLPDGWLKSSGNLGWVGVEVFFVISGYAMMVATRKTSVRWSDYGTFIGKRLLRLHPPYLATVLLILLLNWLSTKAPGFHGPAFTFHLPQFASHLAYAAPFFQQEWYNPVFWTLCIEVQWYLLVGLLGRALGGPSRQLRWCIFGMLLALAFLPSRDYLLFRYLPLFCFGIAAFQGRVALVKAGESTAALLLCAVASYCTLGFTITLAAFLTTIALTQVRTSNRALLWLGGISYSLYLLHVPIGGRIINLAQRLPQTLWFELSALVFAVLASIGAAYLLWKFVEAPSHRAAQRLGGIAA